MSPSDKAWDKQLIFKTLKCLRVKSCKEAERFADALKLCPADCVVL